MTRGGRKKDRDGPERRCIATGDSGPTVRLIRFVLDPQGHVVPDLAGKLPGRGAWLTADRALVEKAVKKRLFSRAFRKPAEAREDLADQIETLLVKRLIETLSLARKAGQAVTGAEKVRARIKEGSAAVLLQARDGAEDGRAKLRALARAAGDGSIAEIELLDAAQMGLAFGREFAIHAALDAGGFAERVRSEAGRLEGMLGGAHPGQTAGDQTGMDANGVSAPASGRNNSAVPEDGTGEQDDR